MPARVAHMLAESCLINNDQSCIAAERFIVVDSVRARFEAEFVQRMSGSRQAPGPR